MQKETLKTFVSSHKALVTCATAIFSIFVLSLAAQPLKLKAAESYVQKGDEYLANKKFLHADLAYEKAMIISPKDDSITQKKALIQDAQLNVKTLENFYKNSRFPIQQEKLNQALSFPKDETEAVKTSKSLIEEGEYQLAAIPAFTATEMDPEYLDAWLYLGIANFKTAHLVELTGDIRDKYISDAKEAFNKAKQIDPENETARKYLEAISD